MDNSELSFVVMEDRPTWVSLDQPGQRPWRVVVPSTATQTVATTAEIMLVGHNCRYVSSVMI